MSTSRCFPVLAIPIAVICSLGMFAQQIDPNLVPGARGANVSLSGIPLDVVIDRGVSVVSGDLPTAHQLHLPSPGKTRNADFKTVSITTLRAPEKASRSYEKAREAFAKAKLETAEQELRKAVALYPQFGVAWTLLARVHEKQARMEEARDDYLRARSADTRLVRPCRRLAEIAFENKNWKDVVQLTSELIRIDSSRVPVAYLYNAAANFNSGNLAAAEQSARRLESLDARHLWPKAYLLLADILKREGIYGEAAQQLNTFLKIVPDDPSAGAVRQEAERLGQLASAAYHLNP